jgi:hypothetical protein
MKKFSFFSILVFSVILSQAFQMFDVSDFGATLAMAIPVGTMYSLNQFRNLGETAIMHPSEWKRTLVAQDDIGFGLAVSRGTNPGSGRLFSGASQIFVGVAARSIEASKLDDNQYADKDVLAIFDTGVPSVYVEEAVNEHSPVRIRHTVGTDPEQIVGGFATTAENDKTTLITGAKFLGSTTGPGIVPIHLSGVYTQTPDAA